MALFKEFQVGQLRWLNDCTDYWGGHMILYRAYEQPTESGRGSTIYVMGYKIVGYTRCGVQIDAHGKRPKFVNLRASKQFASATRDEALRQLWYRKSRQICILKSRLAVAEATYSTLEREGFAPWAPVA